MYGSPHNAPRRAIQLVGIDVDGTLVGSSGIVDPAVWQMAIRARESGIRLALCSGRPAFGVALEYARRLDSDGWHVFQNGASIVDLSTRHSRSAPLPASTVNRMADHARRTGAVLELYSDDQYVSESTSEWAREHAALLGVPFEARPFESLAGPAVRAQWLLSSEEARLVMTEPHPGLEVAQSTSPLMPGVQFVGFTRAGISKGSAIRTVAAEYRIALQDVMYVGDAGNDIPAMQLVGHPIAMANADAAVLGAAIRAVGDVDAGGLVQALELAISSHAR